jgi:DNA modification methylase
MDYEEKKLETVVMVPPSSGPATKVHPATFPVRLPEKYILAMSNSGDGVIEPFCGSGTTLIASEKTGRICYGMELEPKYCKVIIERWEQMTGRKAKLCDENQ